MQILVADLHEHAASWIEKFAGDQKSVSDVGEVGMKTLLPSVAVRLNHLWLSCHVFVVTVPHISLAHKRLEVRSKLTPYGGSM